VRKDFGSILEPLKKLGRWEGNNMREKKVRKDHFLINPEDRLNRNWNLSTEGGKRQEF